MNIELATLRMVNTRERYDRYAAMIPAGTVNKETAVLLKRMGEFFKATEGERIQHDQFWPFLRSRYPNWKETQVEEWNKLTKPIDTPNPHGLDEQIIENLMTTALSTKLVEFIEKWQAGDEIDLPLTLRESIEEFDAQLDRKIKTPFVSLDWEAMAEEETHNVGLQWRLPSLAAHMRSMRPGDFGIWAMRPDRGKTSGVASELTFMAPQLEALYPDRFRPAVWLNNEGPGSRILGRLRQAALGMSAREMFDFGIANAKAKFKDLMGGRDDRIQVLDIHGFTSWEVEELIRKTDPGLVVYDMIDNIRFGGGGANNGERNDQILEAMYQWGRVLGVKYEFAAIATSQISGDGEGLRYPTQAMLKDSKTGKQGACDFIITGGFDPNMPNTRFIGCTKNKLKREGMPSSPQIEVMFDQDRCRFNEATIVEE